ncbi:MAG TPA: glycosyltransferase 87 family protein [Anaerolineales bacterium]|nr:glycosyltransferase 87 family protein [Anaerolineales bacterium]
MSSINFRRVFIMAALGSLVIVYSFLFLRLLATPAENTGSDFIAWYAGGRVADLWGSANAYDLDLQQAIQAQVVGFELAPGQVLIFNHPPYLVPLLALFMDGNYLASLGRYAALMALVYAAGLAIAYCLMRMDGWERSPAWLLVAGLATFYPLFVSLLNTQDTALMVLGGFLWLFGLRQKKDLLAGLGLALTTVRPHITLLLALPFLFRRRGVFWGFCLAAVGLAGISLLSVGIAGAVAYVHILLISAGGQWFGMHENAMVNLVGLLTRLFPADGNLIRWIGWGTYFACIVSFCVVWGRTRELDDRHFALLIVCGLFFVPHLHYHDLALLLVPLLLVLLQSVKRGHLEPGEAALVPLAASLVLLVGGLAPFLKYELPYLLMIWLVLGMWAPARAFFWHKRGEVAA